MKIKNGFWVTSFSLTLGLAFLFAMAYRSGPSSGYGFYLGTADVATTSDDLNLNWGQRDFRFGPYTYCSSNCGGSRFPDLLTAPRACYGIGYAGCALPWWLWCAVNAAAWMFVRRLRTQTGFPVEWVLVNNHALPSEIAHRTIA